MEKSEVPSWEPDLIDEMIRAAEERREGEKAGARKRALQLAREHAYQRLAVELDRPGRRGAGANQLSLFVREATLFDESDDRPA